MLALYAMAAHAADPTTWLREQRTVIVERVPETWQLVWEGMPPVPACGAVNSDDAEISNMCPCMGLAYGEAGHLLLVRKRKSREIDRLALDFLFAESEFGATYHTNRAVLRRWPTESDDIRRANEEGSRLVEEIKRRPAAKIMEVADYDHDGRATEFLIAISTMPCGKVQYAAVGISRDNPHLHALTSRANPEKPLIMPLHAWRALRDHSGTSTVKTWACGDHFSEHRWELRVSAVHGKVDVAQREFSCPENGSSERLLDEQPY